MSFVSTPVATIDVVHVVAVLGGVGGVDVVKDKSVAAKLQVGWSRFAVPVLVAAEQVRVESLELIWALKLVLLGMAEADQKGSKAKCLQ